MRVWGINFYECMKGTPKCKGPKEVMWIVKGNVKVFECESLIMWMNITKKSFRRNRTQDLILDFYIKTIERLEL